MQKLSLSITAAVAISAGSVMADDHNSSIGYVLAENGTALLSMSDLRDIGKSTMVQLGEQLDAIAYRPVTGDLLGFSRSNIIYTINPETGVLTNVNASFADEAEIGDGAVAFDFNNAIDAVRLVGASGANLVYFPAEFGDERANRVLRFTDTFYADGDVNEGIEPLVYANAYTNAVSGSKASTTFQYALDARTDSLVSLANNAGTLTTIAAVTIDGEPVDLLSAGGMDIVSMEEGSNAALAILQIGADTSGLYRIDLETAETVLLADLEVTGITGFAAHSAR